MDMNKDKIGLLKYISVFVLEALIPELLFHIFLMILYCDQNNTIIFKCLTVFLIAIFFLLPFVYLLLPIIFTIIAIKQHWSSYLDKFFNQLKLPTIILGLVIIVMIVYAKLDMMIDYSYSPFWVWFYFAIILPYCLIYSVILVHNLIRIFKERINKKD